MVECAGLEIRYTVLRIEGSNPSFSANTSPSNLLSGPRRRTEPRTTRGFLLWAPDRASGRGAQKPVSAAPRLRTS